MFEFLWFLLPGFALVGTSSFTAAMCRRWGARTGERLTAVLRTYLGMPAIAVGIALAVVEPTAPVLDVGPWGTVVGWLLVTLGAVVFVWGHVLLGRITGWPTLQDPVVERGLYGVVRHPITDGALLAAVGAFLAHPTGSMAVAAALCIVGLVVQTRLEEIDLIERLPGYADYKRRVPWLLPRLRGGTARRRDAKP